jgi:DNA-binding NtrC family response regulator
MSANEKIGSFAERVLDGKAPFRYSAVEQGDRIYMIRIGLYSEDRALLSLLSSVLGKGFQISIESCKAGMTGMFPDGASDVAILDLDPNWSSQTKLKSLSKHLASGKVPLVVMADDCMRQTAVDLVQQGAYIYCRKPPSIRELKTTLGRAYEFSLLKQRIQPAPPRAEEAPSCDQMFGSSPQMQHIYDIVRRVKDINASVLVTGESGTGKELVAKAIHNLGIRASRPFVAVSCGAIPETLIEAELFGHEKGAFTGSIGARKGYLEQASDGTLFLDEIGELSPSTQVKLLRVLQQREFSRLGCGQPIPLRARLIFATHADLAELVKQGRFRLDLFYRINVMQIEVPSLQARPEDIPAMAMHFLRQYSEMYQKPVKDIQAGAMAQLKAYSWVGNVRELENVIQRAIILTSGETVGEEDLPWNHQEDNVIDIGDYQPMGSFERQLRDYKVKLAEIAVRNHCGNKTLAARSLQISRTYLHRLIRCGEQDQLIQHDGQELGIG